MIGGKVCCRMSKEMGSQSDSLGVRRCGEGGKEGSEKANSASRGGDSRRKMAVYGQMMVQQEGKKGGSAERE